MVNYDGLVRPSEISITSIGLWVRFYDLPPAMMKESVVRQLGRQLGRYMMMDCSYLRYMWVRVEYPLDKPLMSQLSVKIKGRGQMPIILRYENVPHFCFSCGRFGRAVMNCQEHSSEEQGFHFGEELRASPPKRVKTISIQQGEVRVACPLFQVMALADKKYAGAGETSQEHHADSRAIYTNVEKMGAKETMQKVVSEDLLKSVHELRVTCNSTGTSQVSHNLGGKGRVAFGTNMLTEEEVSDGASVEQKPPELMIVVERFHMREFKDHHGAKAEKRAILKAAGLGNNKKQKTPVKSYVKDALQSLVDEQIVAGCREEGVEEPMELSKEGLFEETNLLKIEPQHLTRTHDESRQEK
jgi:hypothetical protein